MHDRDDFAFRAVHEWKTLFPTLEATEDEMKVFIRLSRVFASTDRIDERVLRHFEHEGVRATDDFRTIALLRRSPMGLSNSGLIEQLGGSKGGMSARLERFATHGICERTKSAFDRRSHTNTLTHHGVDLADRLVMAVVLGRKALTETLTPDEIHALAEILAKVIEQVDPGG